MNLNRILADVAPNKLFLAIVLGVGSGFVYSLLIPLIMLSLEARSSDALSAEFPNLSDILLSSSTAGLFWLFLGSIVAIMVTNTLSSIMLMEIAIDATSQLRRYYYRRITELPIDELYGIGQARLVSIISADTPNIVTAAISIPRVFISAVTVCALLAFIAYIDNQTFLIVLTVLTIGSLLHYGPVLLSKTLYAQYRVKIDVLLQNVNALIYGAKELKLNSAKRKHFLDELLADNEQQMVHYRKRAELYMSIASAFGGTVIFIAIGAVLYVLGYYLDLSAEQLVTLVMALLYLSSPINTIVFNVTAISRGNVSLEHMQSLMSGMNSEASEPATDELPQWSRIYLREVEYRHVSEGGGRGKFKLGPVSLEIRRGETLFIAGGNGSGKSTLGKLISLLYLPSNGSMSFDDCEITASNRQQFREIISAIFTDYFLFQRVIGTEGNSDAAVSAYLKEYGLEKKVTIENGRLSSVMMSDGQRKRLALIACLLEKRELLVFDEWAADQDVEYKETFYRETLPQLRQLGKTVVVITHDDRYFGLADRVVRMENARIVAIHENRRDSAAAATQPHDPLSSIPSISSLQVSRSK